MQRNAGERPRRHAGQPCNIPEGFADLACLVCWPWLLLIVALQLPGSKTSDELRHKRVRSSYSTRDAPRLRTGQCDPLNGWRRRVVSNWIACGRHLAKEDIGAYSCTSGILIPRCLVSAWQLEVNLVNFSLEQFTSQIVLSHIFQAINLAEILIFTHVFLLISSMKWLNILLQPKIF